MNLTENIMQFYLANYFDIRRNIVVPNIYWGFLHYEADLVICTPSGYLYEIEIKTTKNDLKQESKKKHNHVSKYFKKLYFAIPEKLLGYAFLIPLQAGIITVSESGFCRKTKEAHNNLNINPLKIEEKFNLARLGTMRIWKLYRYLYIKK